MSQGERERGIETITQILPSDFNTGTTIQPRRTALLRAAEESKGIGPAGVDVDALPVLEMGGDPEHELRTTGLLGEGGMGRVDLAVQRSLRREVAVKTVKGDEPRKVDALLREAVYTGYLEHPNVVPVHQLGRDADGHPLLVMKRVAGDAWCDLLRIESHPRWEQLAQDRLRANLEVLTAVCNALEFAHAHGIVHRDIKPSNVMLGDFGQVYLLDWGLALRLDRKDEGATQLVGTPAYLAPEMFQGEENVTEKTDVYLLGATLHEALTGTTRHTGQLRDALLSAQLSDPVEYGAEVPAELAALCNRAMHVDPDERPDVPGFRRALEEYLEHRSSFRLSQQAGERLEVLGEELAAETPRRERVGALFAECRFGFEQALRIWSGNRAAEEGLQDCLERVIDFELAQRNLVMAESLRTSLPRPVADLDERLEALRTSIAAESDAPERLRALERELDPRVSGLQRLFIMIPLGVLICLGIFGTALLRRRGRIVLNQEIVLEFNVATVLLFGLGVFVGRRHFLRTTISRRLTLLVFVWAGQTVVNRLVAIQLALDINTSLALDGITMTLIWAAAGATFDPRAFFLAGISAVATVIGAGVSEYALESYAVAFALCFLAGLMKAPEITQPAEP